MLVILLMCSVLKGDKIDTLRSNKLCFTNFFYMIDIVTCSTTQGSDPEFKSKKGDKTLSCSVLFLPTFFLRFYLKYFDRENLTIKIVIVKIK